MVIRGRTRIGRVEGSELLGGQHRRGCAVDRGQAAERKGRAAARRAIQRYGIRAGRIVEDARGGARRSRGSEARPLLNQISGLLVAQGIRLIEC